MEGHIGKEEDKQYGKKEEDGEEEDYGNEEEGGGGGGGGGGKYDQEEEGKGRGGGKGEMVEVDMYVWDGDMSEVSLQEPWELEVFIADRLGDWLDLFEGMELVGGDED